MRVIPMLLLVAAISGCAGTNFDYDDARQVKIGMTEAQVLELMDKPYSVTQNGNSEIWVWSRANGFTGSSRAVSFILRDGVVVGVPKIPVNIGDSHKQIAAATMPAAVAPAAAPSAVPADQTHLLSEKSYKDEQVRLLMQKGLPYEEYQRQYRLIMGQ